MPLLFFTADCEGILRVIETEVLIGLPFDGTTSKGPPLCKPYKAIWDTGASMSVIMQKVIDELGLKSIGMTPVISVQSKNDSPTYLVSIALPNLVGFQSVRVVSGKILHADMLIGMDIISHGDFAISNHGGKTCFSFRIPSLERIDLGKSAVK